MIPLLQSAISSVVAYLVPPNFTSGADGYLRGVVSNVEILQTAYETIPEELLYFVVRKQLLINDDWCKLEKMKKSSVSKNVSLCQKLAQEECNKPPALKRKKVT